MTAFVMVSPLLVLLALAALQIVLVSMVRMTVTTIALESARVGAAWDAGPSDAELHAGQLLAEEVSDGTVKQIDARQISMNGTITMQVRIVMNPMSVGPLPSNELTITAHAIEESQ